MSIATATPGHAKRESVPGESSGDQVYKPERSLPIAG